MGLNFQTYLPDSPAYAGGKSRTEIAAKGKETWPLMMELMH